MTMQGVLGALGASVLALACGGAGEVEGEVQARAFDLRSGARTATDDASVAQDAPLGTDESLVASVLAPLRPVTGTDERRHLVYELLLQNTGAVELGLLELEVREAGRRAPLARFSGEALVQRVPLLAATGGSLPPGGAAVAFVELALERDRRVPRRLEHRFVVSGEQGRSRLSGPDVSVGRERPSRVGLPLAGDQLVAVNGCCDSGHRRAVFALPEGLFVSQRFAIDFVRAQWLSSFEGDPSDNASFFIYGAEVLAVAPGVVVAVHDGVADNVPTEPLPPPDLATAAGNHVIQALADGHFALYAHLQPGSLRVQVGDAVELGEVLGLVGNTGNSTEPHLHFQVMDRPSVGAADGLPYVFDDFRLQARVDVSGPEPVVEVVEEPQRRRNRLPLALDVIAAP